MLLVFLHKRTFGDTFHRLHSESTVCVLRAPIKQWSTFLHAVISTHTLSKILFFCSIVFLQFHWPVRQEQTGFKWFPEIHRKSFSCALTIRQVLSSIISQVQIQFRTNCDDVLLIEKNTFLWVDWAEVIRTDSSTMTHVDPLWWHWIHPGQRMAFYLTVREPYTSVTSNFASMQTIRYVG